MEINYKIMNPNDMELKLEITMPLRDWKKLETQLVETSWPASDFKNKILEFISKSETFMFQ